MPPDCLLSTKRALSPSNKTSEIDVCQYTGCLCVCLCLYKAWQNDESQGGRTKLGRKKKHVYVFTHMHNTQKYSP